jgi:hypothetical protein
MKNNKMEVVKSHTTVNNFGSDTIKRDFEKEGKINITFYIQNKFIGVDVNGFSNTWSYNLNTRTENIIESEFHTDHTHTKMLNQASTL